MEIRQLRYFVTVAEELHFGRAADRLHIAQPAVSQQISRLERELGVKLLERTSRSVALTGAGTRLLPEARAALTAVDRVSAVASAARTVRIGISPGLGDRVARGLARLRADAPDVTLEIVDGSPARHAADIRAGRLDVALVREPVRQADLESVEVWRDPLVAIVPAGFSPSPLKVSDLSAGVLRLPPRDSDPALHDTVLAACRASGFAPCLGRPVGSLETAMVEIGAGGRDWTVVYAGTPRPSVGAVVESPFTPELTVPGYLVTGAGMASACAAGLLAAFS